MHAGNGDGFFPRLSLVNGYNPSTVYANRHPVSLFAGNYTPLAVYAALYITQKFHPGHFLTSLKAHQAFSTLQSPSLVPWIWVIMS